MEQIIAEYVRKSCEKDIDPTHDFMHVKRVVNWSKKISEVEGGRLDIVVPAAYLHDIVNIPKNDPRRSQASRLSADFAVEFLKKIGYASDILAAIHHAIAAHSFSAEIKAETLEAKIVQDADRLEGLGAIGIARCFATAGRMNRVFYSEIDPFCVERAADDSFFTVDHFYKKLFKVANSLQTETGRKEGARRVKSMRQFLGDLNLEIS